MQEAEAPKSLATGSSAISSSKIAAATSNDAIDAIARVGDRAERAEGTPHREQAAAASITQSEREEMEAPASAGLVAMLRRPKIAIAAGAALLTLIVVIVAATRGGGGDSRSAKAHRPTTDRTSSGNGDHVVAVEDSRRAGDPARAGSQMRIDDQNRRAGFGANGGNGTAGVSAGSAATGTTTGPGATGAGATGPGATGPGAAGAGAAGAGATGPSATGAGATGPSTGTNATGSNATAMNAAGSTATGAGSATAGATGAGSAAPPVAKPAVKRLGGKKVVLEYDTTTPPPKVPPKKAASADADAASVGAARITYFNGNRKLFSGDADAAIKLYKQALAMYPGYVAGYRGLGLAYAQKGDKPNALKAFRTYISAVPTAKDIALIKKRIATLQK